MASQLIVHPLSAPLRGSIPLPGDQDLALARVALAALCRGRASLAFSGEQRSLRVLCNFLALIGVRSEWESKRLHIFGQGLASGEPLTRTLDLRGEVAVAALALGLLASRPWPSELLVDDVVVQLLVPALALAHQVDVKAEAEGGHRVALGARTDGVRHDGLEVVTHGVYPWIKEAILLSGLRAKTVTLLEERIASADHLERAMTRARMPLDVQGTIATLHPPRDSDAVAPQIYEDIGSSSLAVHLCAAVLMHPGGELNLREICLNPTRAGAISVLRLAGAEVGVSPRGDRQGEPYGDLSVKHQPLKALSLGGETMIRVRDGAVSLLAVAARAKGTSLFTDLVTSERGADPKIWLRAVGLLRSAGVEVETTEGGIQVTGTDGGAFKPLTVTTGGDSRLALLATVLALGATEPSVIDNVDCLAEDFPRFAGSLRALGAKIEVKTA